MPFKKQDIYKALETITEPGEGKSLVENNNVTNIVAFGNEVIVDVTISNPCMKSWDGMFLSHKAYFIAFPWK